LLDDNKKTEFERPLVASAGAPCSLQLFKFYKQHFAIFDFFFFSVALARRHDEGRMIAAKALAVGGDVNDLQRLEDVEQNKQPAFDKLVGFRYLQSEYMVIRLVDNYVSFVSEILQSCLVKRPEMLRTKDTISIEDVLRFESREKLIGYLIDQKLNSLTYGGVAKLDEFIQKRTGFSIADDREEQRLLFLAIELRNIYTHNRGVVNDVIVRRLSRFDYDFGLKLGARFHADYDLVCNLANNIHLLASRLDSQLALKFDLAVKSVVDWEGSVTGSP
jgi:hypothetical protein